MKHKKLILMLIAPPLLLLLFVEGLSTDAMAEIYRFQDPSGKWYFTDKRPEPDVQVDVMGYDALPVDSRIMDLEAALVHKFNPRSVLERSALAVVSIQSPVANGIGFFISPYGHLVTHRHLVRPAETASWQQSKQALEQRRVKLEKIKRELVQRKEELLVMEQQLAHQKASLLRLQGVEKQKAARDYRIAASRLPAAQEDSQNYQDFYQRRKREYDRENAKFSVLSAVALSAKTFIVQLKDRTKLSADLLAVSDAHDLALLRVPNLKTPHIDYATAHTTAIGAKVFALGNPIAREDPVTAGVITHVFKEVLMTDMVLHRTEAGAPLINSTGQLVGINTPMPSDTGIDPSLFGAALPSQTLYQEFASHLVPGLAQR